MSTAEGTAVLLRGSAPSVPARTQVHSTNEPSWLFTCVALLGIAALSSAAASSLLPGFSEVFDGGPSASGLGGPLMGIAGVFSAAFGLAALAYALLALRRGKLIRTQVLIPTLGIAAGIHLIALLVGLWRMPVAERTFDMTIAAMLILELSATAVLGWARNAPLRRPTRQRDAAAAVVGTLFVISVFVAALTTVGMAASTAGELAVPHSGHSDSGPGGSGHDSHSDQDSNVVPANLQRLKDQGHHH